LLGWLKIGITLVNSMIEIKAPNAIPEIEDGIYIFLAGTIDNGESEDWQAAVAQYVSQSVYADDIILINPRRDNWNPDATDVEVEEQVLWELQGLERANTILMVFLGDSKSPISLLETGLHAKSEKLHVVCSDKFYRYVNVKTTCDFYGVPITDDLEYVLEYLFPQK